ncbi:hypothetical protein TDB9533_03134 [Thalassocella blandensis]|nr:hypothetical protein TDB9533_03134 [Thalassocella blandensis]
MLEVRQSRAIIMAGYYLSELFGTELTLDFLQSNSLKSASDFS